MASSFTPEPIMAYLGETPVALADSPYKDTTPAELALEFIQNYGGIDGAHHKTWVLDQVARILNGSPIEDLRRAEWDDTPAEYRFEIGASDAYRAWVVKCKAGKDGPDTYDYDEGIAP